MKVKKVTTRHYQGPIYDLEVKGAHAYYANGIRVHNCHCRLEFDRKELLAMAKGENAVTFFDGTGPFSVSLGGRA